MSIKVIGCEHWRHFRFLIDRLHSAIASVTVLKFSRRTVASLYNSKSFLSAHAVHCPRKWRQFLLLSMKSNSSSCPRMQFTFSWIAPSTPTCPAPRVIDRLQPCVVPLKKMRNAMDTLLLSLVRDASYVFNNAYPRCEDSNNDLPPFSMIAKMTHSSIVWTWHEKALY